MKQLEKNRYQSISNLFPKTYPNLPLIFSIIEGLIPGQIWVDKEIDTEVCLIVTNAPYCYMSGKVDEKTFATIIEILEKKPIIKLAVEPAQHFDLTKFGFTLVPRRQYRYTNSSATIPFYENNSNYLIKRIENLENFNACLWKQLMLDIYGSPENFLKNGIGFIMWDDDKKIVASEALGISSKKFIEVATVTNQDYRRQNLSTILCNYLIRFSLAKKLQPVWSCDETNVISWRVAEKQGMDELIPYIFYTRS